MKIAIMEKAVLRGHFRMRVYLRGVLIETFEDHNLIVDGARSLVIRLISGNGNGVYVNRIAFGTNGNIPVPNDTEIAAPVIKTVDQVSYPSANQAQFDWSLAKTEGNGKEIREFGLLCTDNTLFARKVRLHPIYKDSDIALEGQWIITN